MKEIVTKLSEPIVENVENLTLPLTKTIGNTFSSFWEFAIGSHVSLAREKQMIRQSEKLQLYKENILSKIEAIPEEQLIEAPLHVVGPAIESAKYYIESEDLSEMFSNLISASFDSNMISVVHPSFTEIIKQLSPVDAKNMALYKNTDALPICHIKIKWGKGVSTTYRMVESNYFLENEEIQDLNIQAASISNLIRLGLLESPPNLFIKSIDIYRKYEEHSTMNSAEKALEKAILEEGVEQDATIELEKRVVRLTPFGNNFCEVIFKNEA